MAYRRLLPLLVACLTSTAMAHTGHDAGGHHAFASGLLHPWLGWDHLLAMLAVGIWAVQLGGRAVWALPTTFVAAMLAGCALEAWAIHVPMTESSIVVSVLLLGTLIAINSRPPLAVAATLTGLCAVFHGAAHAAEVPAGASLIGFAAGFALATGALHALGVFAAIRSGERRPALTRIGGGAMVAAGVVFGLLPGLAGVFGF